MATSLLSANAPALSLTFQNKIARQWNRLARTASLFEVKPGNGKSVNWAVSLPNQTAATYTEGADVSSGELLIDTKLPAVLNWARYRNGWGYSDHQLDAAQSSPGSADEMMDLLGESVLESTAALASKLNSEFFVGTGASDSLVGLNSGLITSGTYAGIDVGTYPSFASTINANGGTPRNLDLNLMNTVEASIFTASGFRPDFIVTTPALMTKYKSLFEVIRRVPGDNPSIYNTGVQDDGVFFMGIPVIRDINCPAGTMYFLNRDSMHFCELPTQYNKNLFQFLVKMGAGSAAGEGEMNQLGLNFTVRALPNMGDATRFMAKSTCQLVIRNPNRNAILKDLQ